jgi:hypothetical protein
MAMKVFAVDGVKIVGHTGNTQDFVLASGPTFPSGTAERFLRDKKMLRTATPMPEVVKSAVSSIARNVDSASRTVLGAPSLLADFFGHPFSHPLSEPYFSQAPLRFGDYICKLAAFPVERPQLENLKQNHIDTSKDENAFRAAVIGHFKSESLEYDIRVQLWTHEDSQPLEDASVERSQEDSPYITVARLSIPSQAAYSTEDRDTSTKRCSSD